NVNSQFHCGSLNLGLLIIQTGCSTTFQEHAAGKTFGIDAAGRLVSFFTFYDQGYATLRPFNVSDGSRLPDGSTTAANFIGYGSPEINTLGPPLYAKYFLEGGAPETRNVWTG